MMGKKDIKKALLIMGQETNHELMFNFIIAKKEGLSPSLKNDAFNGSLYVAIPNGVERLANGRSFDKIKSFNIFIMNELMLALAFKHNVNFNIVKKASEICISDVIHVKDINAETLSLYSSKEGLNVYGDITYHIIIEIICQYKNAEKLIDEAQLLLNQHIDLTN